MEVRTRNMYVRELHLIIKKYFFIRKWSWLMKRVRLK